jgi:enterochelin esterase-like enzyme
MRECLVWIGLAASLCAQGAELKASKIERVELESESLGQKVKLLLQIPLAKEEGEKFPVIVFLHGLRGSETTWTQRGAQHDYDAALVGKKIQPAIVVCPDGRNSFWMNGQGKSTQKYGDFLVKDLVAYLGKNHPVREGAKSRALLGDSMGGFGALLQAFSHPEVYGIVAAHQPSVFPEDRTKLPNWVQQGRGGSLLTNLFGDPVNEEAWLGNNLFHLARTLEPSVLQKIDVYFDVGKQDRYGLADPNQAFHTLLEERKVGHDFHLRDGGHGREFYLDNLPHSLAFIDAAFKKGNAKGD